MSGWRTPQPDHDGRGKIARAPERVADDLRSRTRPGGDGLVATAKCYLRCRLRRASLFKDGDPADPAWDILIDLYVAAEEGKDVSVSDVCLSAMLPLTTGLRWIERLCRAKLVMRVRDVADRRRVFLRLSADGDGKVRDWLSCLRQARE